MLNVPLPQSSWVISQLHLLHVSLTHTMMAPLWISYISCKALMHFLDVFSEYFFFLLKFWIVLSGSFYSPLIRLFPKLLSFCLIFCVDQNVLIWVVASHSFTSCQMGALCCLSSQYGHSGAACDWNWNWDYILSTPIQYLLVFKNIHLVSPSHLKSQSWNTSRPSSTYFGAFSRCTVSDITHCCTLSPSLALHYNNSSDQLLSW